jgi:hypothetical protein
MRVAVRGYVGYDLIFQEIHEVEEVDLEKLAFDHAKMLAYTKHMIEFEFLDEPDPLKRFFRFGTDPTRMVDPMGLKL